MHALVDANAARYNRFHNLHKINLQVQADMAEVENDPSSNQIIPARFQPVDLHDRSTQPLLDPTLASPNHLEYDILADVQTMHDQPPKPGRSCEKLGINLLPQAD